jgi:Domain of unknown function (DUF222)
MHPRAIFTGRSKPLTTWESNSSSMETRIIRISHRGAPLNAVTPCRFFDALRNEIAILVIATGENTGTADHIPGERHRNAPVPPLKTVTATTADIGYAKRFGRDGNVGGSVYSVHMFEDSALPSGADGGALVDALVECGRQVAHSQARSLAAMVAVADRSVGVGFDADEVAFALHLPRMVAQREVALGRDLMHRLPAVFAALEHGRIDLARARVFSDLLSAVHDDGLARVIAVEFLPAAEEWTASQLRSRLQRAILAADPDAAGQRYERSVAERRVELTANPDTTAQLAGIFLPPQKAATAFERVDALARGLKNDGDTRTLDQLRADVFCDLLAGTVVPDAQPVRRPGIVELLVPLATVTGQSHEPGVLAGYGPVVADIARQVAEQAAGQGSGYQWRFRVYDPDGTLLHNGVTRLRPTGARVIQATPRPPAQSDETARFPSLALRRWITARDTTCRAPGCTAPARSADIDHTTDHADGGATRHDNLGLLCRHHHRLKHEGGFDLAQPQPGTFVWTSPSGKAYTTDPDPPW